MTGWRWLVVAARATAIVLLFAAIIPFHLLLTLLGRRAAIPPLFLRGVGWLAGLRVRRQGSPAPGPLLLVANHTSWLDIFALAGTARAAFVAKGALAESRPLAWLCRQNDTLFVARERRGGVGGQVATLRAALARRRMAVFPEGTTSDGTVVLPFKSALLSVAEGAEVAVQPVALAYPDAPAIAWHGAESGAANVLRVLARLRPVRVTVRILPPLSGAERATRKTMAAAAQRRIAGALGLPDAAPSALPMPPPIA